MSVAYRSWEVASGPIVGLNMGIQSNVCATSADTLLAETPNYCSNTVLSHESLMKAVSTGTDVSKGLTFSNHKALTPQDTVIRGLSSLSLHPQSQLQAGCPSKDYETSPPCESSNRSLELNCSVPLANSNHKGFEDVSCCVSALQAYAGSSDVQGSINPNGFWVATRNYIPLYDKYRGFEFYDFPKHTLDVVAEDKPYEENFAVARNDELELDALSASSTSSVSSLLDPPVDGSVSSGQGFHGAEDSEAQKAFKESYMLMGGSSPPRKGLSRFYSGKSRSFSCLGDAMSLKDLAKSESPYAKKRRCLTSRSSNTDHPQLSPLQRGAASISKKAVHSGKSTLALAVTMSTREEPETKDGYQSFLGAQRSQPKSPLTSRSYSLSDLQRVTESRVSPC